MIWHMGIYDEGDIIEGIHELKMETIDNGFGIQDSANSLDQINGDMADRHDDIVGLLNELVDQADGARTENAFLHAAAMAQTAGMWSDMNAGIGELAEGQQEIAARISDVDETLVNIGGMVDGRLTEIRGEIAEHRQDTVNAIGRVQGEVEIAGTKIAVALYKVSELLSSTLEKGFAKLNAEEERRMAALRSDLRRSAEMPRENQALEIYKVAAANYAIGDYTQAAKDVVEALKLKSNHIPSLILLGKIAKHKGKADFARSRFTRALLHAIHQKNAIGFEHVIKEFENNYLQQGDPEKAIKVLKRAIVIAKKDFPEMVGRLEWECFKIYLLIPESKNGNYSIKTYLNSILRKYPERWEALVNDREFSGLREEYPYLHLTSTAKKAEEISGNEVFRQEMQWVKEIETFLKIKVPKIKKMTKQMIEALSSLEIHVGALRHDLEKNVGHIAKSTTACKEVFGKVMKTYNELPENIPPERRVIKRAEIVPERKPERWSLTEAQLASMSLEQFMETLKKFPASTIKSHQISHGAMGTGDHETSSHIVTNDFTRILRTGRYDVKSPVRRQEKGNAIYILVPEPKGENWQVRKDGEGININAGILFLPKSTLVDERTGSKFALDADGLPKLDPDFNSQLWDIFSKFSKDKRVAWRNISGYGDKQSVEQEKVSAMNALTQMKSKLDSNYNEFMKDFERQFTGESMDEERRDVIWQFVIATAYYALDRDDCQIEGLSSDDIWNNIILSINRIRRLYEIGLLKPKRVVTAESYWREFFKSNPHLTPSKIVYYDGDIAKAWSEFSQISNPPKDALPAPKADLPIARRSRKTYM